MNTQCYGFATRFLWPGIPRRPTEALSSLSRPLEACPDPLLNHCTLELCKDTYRSLLAERSRPEKLLGLGRKIQIHAWLDGNEGWIGSPARLSSQRYPNVKRLTILADGGGSNGYTNATEFTLILNVFSHLLDFGGM